MRKLLLCLAGSLFLTACSSLDVKVSIADPAIGRTALNEIRMTTDLPPLLAQTEVEIGRLLTSMTQEHHAVWRAIRAEYRRQAAAATSDADRAMLTALADAFDDDTFEEDVARVYSARKGALVGITNELRSLCPTVGGCPAANNDRVVALMRQHREHLASLIAFQREDLSEKTADPKLPETIRANAIKAQIAAEADARSLIGRAGLQASPEAYAVISAPKEKWRERFDMSKALGRLGDLNVAIKMERRGNFTIKGVSFDPSEVARVISKMGTQLVLSIAQANGVPVRTASGATATQGLATSSESLGASMAAVETTAAEQADRREALLTIAKAITRERGTIEGSDADARKAAIKATKDTFAAHKSRIGSAAPAPAPVTP